MNKLVILLGLMAIFATCYAGEAKLGRRIRTVASPDGEDLDTAQSGWGGGGYRGFGGGGYGGLGGFGGGGYGGGYGGYGGGGYGGGGYGGGYGGGGWGR